MVAGVAGMGVVFAVEWSHLVATRFKGAWRFVLASLFLNGSFLSVVAGEASVGLVSCAL